ncbi:flagellar hook protein FlgE [Gemmobacter lanyuensis]|uniref:Flagellar hook protein FlgE n=1 Tax=Gemmobacter lanyuensis TaxID=1054497 RepID=A0A918MGW4_9RHOB|nr:flagellar hook protein FlgE [Gemmobacter lanyuensis]GGW21498.1 flagellar hook protein FlgE [Gemmobacter lanyuensis]
MSMNTALSGIQAAQTDISATSHNIANVSTTGFRSSDVSFADVYNSSPYSVARTQVGSGTRVTQVSQNFAQGNITTTGRALDLAIQGQGFFATQQISDTGERTGAALYTRAGDFTLTAEGRITNTAGNALLGWPVSAEGGALSQIAADAGPISVPLSMGQTVASTALNVDVSLPTSGALLGQQAAVPPAAFDSGDATTWAHRTTVPMVSGNGQVIEGELYFVKTDAPDAADPSSQWQVHLVVDGVTTTSAASDLTFDGDGTLTTAQPMAFTDASGGTFSLDMSGSRLADNPFTVQSATADGTRQATMTSLEVDDTGTIWASYGAGRPIAMGKVMVATFANPQGLAPQGNASFRASSASGEPLVGAPGSAGFGSLRSGALEESNVDLTSELVDLITAQRNYQASAKALETNSSLMQSIIKIS